MKECPRCHETVGDWRPSCECGHTFFREKKPKRVVVEDDDGELDDLIDRIEGSQRGGRSRGRTVKRSEHVVVTREHHRRGGLATRGGSTEGSGGIRWARVVLGLVAVTFVLIGIMSYPLQTIAACAVLFVLFVPVVVIYRR